jgi:hypothetical protein
VVLRIDRFALSFNEFFSGAGVVAQVIEEASSSPSRPTSTGRKVLLSWLVKQSSNRTSKIANQQVRKNFTNPKENSTVSCQKASDRYASIKSIVVGTKIVPPRTAKTGIGRIVPPCHVRRFPVIVIFVSEDSNQNSSKIVILGISTCTSLYTTNSTGFEKT